MDRRKFLTSAGVAAVAASALAAPVAEAAASGRSLDSHQVEHSDFAGFGGAEPSGVGVGPVQVVWSVPVSSNGLVLSFDDGPDPAFTPYVLDVLDQFGVRANFNVMGWNVEQHPDLLRRILSAGHEVGNHTWHHLDESQTARPAIAEDVRAGLAALTAAGVRDVRWFRPPRGELTGVAVKAAGELGLDVLMWSATVTSPDPAASAAAVERRAVSLVEAGQVLLLHDGLGSGTFERGTGFARTLTSQHERTLRALPALLRRARELGLRVATASELAPRATA